MSAFANTPLAELRRASVREACTAALTALDLRLPISAPLLLAGAERSADELLSHDPGTPTRVVAHAAVASADEIDAAVTAARAAARGWSRRQPAERAETLRRGAGVLERQRYELAALELRECAKPWLEGDADICEAIDFLRYYADCVEPATPAVLAQPPGEHNTLRYVARGVVAVIAPWNFPLAIPCGMVSAALATGNAVVLKPAEQAPACGEALVRALHEAGVPPGALSVVHGDADVGRALVAHPDVDVIAFTGSNAAGREIMQRASHVVCGQRHFKSVVAELGGKNCIIVDRDADLDEAIPGIVQSAFAFAGQKCSAASRVLVHEAVAPTAMERLAGAVRSLVVGQAELFGVDVGPLIEQEAQQRLLDARARCHQYGTVLAEAQTPESEGWFCPPTLVADLPDDAVERTDELFGPLLCVEPIASVAQGCEIVDALPYALTGAIYSRNPDTVKYVVEASPVGNLYVNRATTGAMVARQPFGGNRLSGTGAQAGGPDYLMRFVEPRVVSENTMRHGLAV